MTNIVQHPSKLVNIKQIARFMKSDTLQKLTLQIQEATKNGNDKLKTKLKAMLPCITPAGIFSERKIRCFLKPSFCYQLDIDGVTSTQPIIDEIINDENLNVVLCSRSVSGNGIKAPLVHE